MNKARSFVSTAIVLLAAATAWCQPVLLDDFASPDTWKVLASDGVRASISPDAGHEAQALRLDFDFERGSGFCVLRRALPMPLPANYRFQLRMRGEGPANNLEFKLLDLSGENVWWVNRRSFEFPREWRTLSYPARKFRFAWGPSGGQRFETLGALEIAVAAGSGGKGSLWFDELTFEALPEVRAAGPLHVRASSAAAGAAAWLTLDETGRLDWHSAATDLQPSLAVEFPAAREIGGLAVTWDEDDYPVAYDVSVSEDGQQWQTVSTLESGRGGRHYLPLRDVEATALRLAVRQTSRGRGVGVKRLRVLEPEFGESRNRMFATIASESPRGWYPRYFLGQQQWWTVVGVPEDDKEALFDVAGALEVDKLGFRLEPFLYLNGRLITWADASWTQKLLDDYLPIPTVTWKLDDAELEITALADGPAGHSTLLAQYRLSNRGAARLNGALYVGIRPFQVLPPWQDLGITGGAAQITSLRAENGSVVVNDQKILKPWGAPDGFGATRFDQGEVIEYLATNKLPPTQTATDPAALASGAWRWNLDLEPGAHTTVVVEMPFHDASIEAASHERGRVEADFDARRVKAGRDWERMLHRVELTLPADAARLVSTFRTTQAYILINADGPAIQPGSRTYERSWIRDGALTSTALLCTGHAEAARRFLDWFAGYQYENGKIPCVVDRRGPDPVPEHDSAGEFLYALLAYYNFTRDAQFLQRHWPQVVSAVSYIEELRKQRLTPEYRDGPPEKRVCYGLVPESISHEGYSAKPMHSYWDDFWIARGLKDAVRLARIMRQPEAEARFTRLRDAFRGSLRDSVNLAVEQKHVGYIPGCAELGDFDATSTAIALFPCEEGDNLPGPLLQNTFARYYDFFCQRRDGKLEWLNYTPYELRLVGTFVRLEQPRQVHELLDFFLHDQCPTGWNQWPEVVWHDPAAPKFIGDLPHTWVGSEFLNAFRSMFVYERTQDEALVLAAGVRPEWLEMPAGVSIARWPTEYGRLSYALRAGGNQIVLTLDGAGDIPPGGLVFRVPGERVLRAVQTDAGMVAAFTEHQVTLKVIKGSVTVTLSP
jgi:hypothetical protein